MNKFPLVGAALALLCAGAAPAADSSQSVVIHGTPHLVPLPTLIANELTEQRPVIDADVRMIEDNGDTDWWRQGSGAALLNRELDAAEMAAFERRWQAPPRQIKIAMNPLVVIVHPQNAIAERGLSLAEVDAIFSESRRRGQNDIRFWSDLGLGGPNENTAIRLYGYDYDDVLYQAFQRDVLQGGQFRPGMTRLPNRPEELVRTVGGARNARSAVAEGDRYGIGFTSLRYLNDTVLAVPLSADDGGEPVAPSAQALAEQRYPLANFVYLYLTPDPLGEARQALLDLLLSSAGQTLVREAELVELPSAILREQLSDVNAAATPKLN